MKKLLLTFVFSLFYISSASAVSVNVGVSGQAGIFAASGSEKDGATVKGNGSEHGSAGWGSVFLEGQFNDRIIVSKNGEITHGDNLRFFITKNYCDELQEVFTFYTTNNHSKINELNGKILTVSMNEYEVKSEVMFMLPFLLGHSAWFNMGRYKIDDHIEFFKNTSLYKVKILND